MKKMIVIGNIGIILILVLVSFTSVANAQTTKTTIVRTSFLQQMKDKIAKNGWYPGWFFDRLAGFVLWLVVAFGYFWFGILPNL